MYSRSTDRGGRRIKLPPGYDGNAFRHDTGEVRRLGGETEMKIHSPASAAERTETVEERSGDGILPGAVWERRAEGNRRVPVRKWREIPEREGTEDWSSAEERDAYRTDGGRSDERDTTEAGIRETGEEAVPTELCAAEESAAVSPKGNVSLLEGLLHSLSSEDWLLFLVILLLLADGSDAWDLILLLGVLLAVK